MSKNAGEDADNASSAMKNTFSIVQHQGIHASMHRL